jgi:hypothetical protein
MIVGGSGTATSMGSTPNVTSSKLTLSISPLQHVAKKSAFGAKGFRVNVTRFLKFRLVSKTLKDPFCYTNRRGGWEGVKVINNPVSVS